MANKELVGIFCHDLPIYKDKNGVYCSTTLTNDVFSRYLKVVDKLFVATRVYPIDKTFEEAHQEKIDLKGLSFLDLKNMNSLSNFFSSRSFNKKLLKKTIKECDLVFIRGGTIAMMGASIARKLHKNYLMESGGPAFEEYWYHNFLGKLLALHFELKHRKDIKHATHVLYVTQKYLQRRYPAKGKAVGVSDVVLPIADEEVLKERIEKINKKDDSSPIVLGTTAAILKHKGQQYVVKAIKRIGNARNFRYEIVGGGDQSYIRKLIKKYHLEEKIIIKGTLSHSEVLKWLKSIDVYVQPSVHEGLSRAIMEAMSQAVPVIASNIAGNPEIVDNNFLFKNRSIKELKELLLKVNKQDLIKMATDNFNTAKEFQPHLLDERRNAFFADFKESATKK